MWKPTTFASPYKGHTMRTSRKIIGILATAGLTYDEFAKLSGLTRQTIHQYLNTDIDLEDFEGGVKCIEIADKIMHLCMKGALPVPRDTPKELKLEAIRKLI